MRVEPTILVAVDDEPVLREQLRVRLAAESYRAVEATTGAEALVRLRDGVDAVLLGCRLPDADGIGVLRAMQQADPDSLVVMLAAESSVEEAVQAMREGAYHYLGKPVDLDLLVTTIQRGLEASPAGHLERRQRARAPSHVDAIVGQSPAIVQLKRLIEKIATSPGSTVLVTGESGTGKDIVARTIHQLSQRSGGRFVNITCSALPEPLLESELFGHERGAFTDARQQKVGLLERAAGGTVFLDEIGEMSPGLQAKLLRFLEDKTFRRVGGTADLSPDVRVIAATHRDLQEQAVRGEFRQDLYYRLAVLHLHVPPLRERQGDVELLTRCFVDIFNREFHKRVSAASPSAMRLLTAYGWPGNVRELKNAVERAVLLAEGGELGVLDFDFLHTTMEPAATFSLPPGGIDLRALERQLVVMAFDRAGGSPTRTAALLGLNRDQVRYRISKYGLRR